MKWIGPMRGQRELAEFIAAETAAKLRESNRLLAMAGNLAQLGYWRFASDENEFELSLPVRQMFGMEPGATLSPREMIERFHPGDRLKALRAIVRARRQKTEAEFRARATSIAGTELHLLIQVQAEVRPGGTVGLFGIVRNATQINTVQQGLISARQDAEAATIAKSEFLATMSHEIRTPMTGVMGMIELLLSNPTEAERDRYLAAMKQSAELLMSVLDGILDFSKAEAGKMEFESRDFDFAALASRTVDMFQNAASKKGLLFHLDITTGASPFVHSDPIRIQQVLTNFISNAIKFTSDGQVTLAIRAQPGGEGRQLWRVQVDDTGIGIAPAEMEYLFEPFVQMGNRRLGGTGLGLAISRRIIEAMGGKTGVSSVPGHGSSFWFEMELAVGAALPAAQDGWATAQNGGQPLHILVAEDNPINQMLIAALLRRLGHRATCVDNGRRALEAAKAVNYDCILLDMQMPQMDGIAATRAIRAAGGRNAKVPIIALTADAAPERRRFYDNVGLTDFMTKPVSVEALRRHLSAISGSRTLSPDLNSDEPVIDTERSAELQLAIGPDRLAEMLAMLRGELVSRLSAIRAAALACDLPAVRAEAHSLNGAAANVGANRIARAAKATELALGGTELQLALARLGEEVAAAMQALPQMIEALDPEPPNRLTTRNSATGTAAKRRYKQADRS